MTPNRTGWLGVTSVYVFFLVGTVANKLIMSPVVRFVMKQERCEGDFRWAFLCVCVYLWWVQLISHNDNKYSLLYVFCIEKLPYPSDCPIPRFRHMRVRVDAESIAFHVSGSSESTTTNRSLDKLLRAQQTLFNREVLSSTLLTHFIGIWWLNYETIIMKLDRFCGYGYN